MSGCFSTSPYIVYAGKSLMSTWCRGGSDGTHYTVTSRGWIARKYQYGFEQIFIPSTSHISRPLLLKVDGHTSHISLELTDI
ncbi:unnamed protein product, partial [Didymodactylos carnosus]